METIADALLYVFYAVTVAALAFFIHKVLWLVQYRRIQSEIVEGAVSRLREGNAQGLAEWEAFAKERWSTALGQADISGPSTFIRRVEEGLALVRRDLRAAPVLDKDGKIMGLIDQHDIVRALTLANANPGDSLAA